MDPWGWQPDYHTYAAIYSQHALALFEDRMRGPAHRHPLRRTDSGMITPGGFLDGPRQENQHLVTAR